MYHPPDLAGGTNDTLNEYIELHNITTNPAPLFCTYTNEAGYGPAASTNTWRLRNAVDFDFPVNTSLAAASRALVVGFDPAANLEQLAAFRTLYGVATNVPVFGPWSGALNNAGETIKLLAPDKPDVTATNVVIPYVLVDHVAFEPAAPWPGNTDGGGSSLQRLALDNYGNDPANWAAAAPTAGFLNVSSPLPALAVSLSAGGTASFLVETTPGLSYQLECKTNLGDSIWISISPAIPAGSTTLILTDTNVPALRRFYRVRGQ
jgi:hypothetical protein